MERMVFLCIFLVFFVDHIFPSSGTKLSITMGTNCDNVSSQSHVVVSNSPVNLTCCIEGSLCPFWNVKWYRNASNELLSCDKVLSVNLDEPQETFLCVAEADNDIPDPVCYEDSQYQGVITVTQGHYCFDDAPVTFIKAPSSDYYALVGQHIKVLPFHLKYVGIHITPFILLNNTHLKGLTSIHHSFHHDIKIESCVEDYNITLYNLTHMYSGTYTMYACTTAVFNKSAEHYSVKLWVCDKPEWCRDMSYVEQNNSMHTATLLCTFTACHTPNNELINFHWRKNKQKLLNTDEHYKVSHRYVNNSLYTLMLTIYHTNVNDSGNYSCHLGYEESKIYPLVAKEGILNLNISSSTSNKPKDSTDWQLTGGLIGGGAVLLLILAVMVVIFHPRPPPTPPPVALGNGQPDNVPLIQQGLDRPDEDTSEAVFGIPQQPESSTTSLDESLVEHQTVTLQVQLLPQPPRAQPAPAPVSKPRTKVEQRLTYYRKDITELLAGREKSEVIVDFKQRNMLDRNQLNHFLMLDEPVQSYTYLIDAILVAGHVVAEKFYRYLLDTDVTDYFYKLVAPKVFLFYVMTSGALDDNIQQFAELLRKCGINVICDFYEPGIGDRANFDGHLWVQQKINDCISSGGYVLVDVSNGPMNNLSHTQDENPKMNMRYTRFDSKTLYQNVIDSRECFVPFCLDNPPCNKVFPFQKDSVYQIDITAFQQSFLEFAETKYLDEFNISEGNPAAIQAFLNEAPGQFKPIVDLISHLTSQQCYNVPN